MFKRERRCCSTGTRVEMSQPSEKFNQTMYKNSLKRNILKYIQTNYAQQYKIKYYY